MVNKYVGKWRTKSNGIKAISILPASIEKAFKEPDESIDSSGLPCERCGEKCPADFIECLYGNYWLCFSCARWHRKYIQKGR